MNAVTKRFYNIGVYPSISKREGDNEAPSPLNKDGQILAQYLLSSTDPFSSFIDSMWSGEGMW